MGIAEGGGVEGRLVHVVGEVKTVEKDRKRNGKKGEKGEKRFGEGQDKK